MFRLPNHSSFDLKDRVECNVTELLYVEWNKLESNTFEIQEPMHEYNYKQIANAVLQFQVVILETHDTKKTLWEMSRMKKMYDVSRSNLCSSSL
jgi:hypothetical protein